MTLSEVRKERQAVLNQIRCIQSDAELDPARVERDFLKHVEPLRAKLERLRYKYQNAAALIAEYTERIAELKAEYKLIVEADRIKKMIRLVKQINKLQGSKIKVLVEENQLTAEQASTIRYLILGYKNEIGVIEKLVAGSYAKREAELVKAITAQETQYAAFCRGLERLEACYARLDELEQIAQELAAQPDLEKLEDTLREMTQLMAGMTPEQIKAALS